MFLTHLPLPHPKLVFLWTRRSQAVPNGEPEVPAVLGEKCPNALQDNTNSDQEQASGFKANAARSHLAVGILKCFDVERKVLV